MKNVTGPSAGDVVFFCVGFVFMFGATPDGLVGTDGFFLVGLVEEQETVRPERSNGGDEEEQKDE